MPDNAPSLSQWQRIVNEVTVGDYKGRFIRIGDTSSVLVQYGLVAGPLVISAAKLATCRRKHPDVETDIWHDLPSLLATPAAIFPSARRDGSVVAALVVTDQEGRPVVVPIQPNPAAGHNAILSVYGKDAGWAWVKGEIAAARRDGFTCYEQLGFAATMPQPEDLSSSSPGPIPADGTAKPVRKILTLRRDVKPPG